MCTNKKKIYNHYIQDYVYVNCGFCEACLQEKANRRTNRIRNHAQKAGLIGLFVTLTYSDDFVPYIRKSEIRWHKPLNIYRDYDRVKVNVSTKPYKVDYVVRPCGAIASKDIVFRSENEMRRFTHGLPLNSFDVNKLPTLRVNGKFDDDRVGVAYFEDVKNFIKRFKINYQRKYNERLPFSYYACTEYGETFRRPHIHMLIFVPKDYQQRTTDTVYQSWPYVGTNSKGVDVQLARNAASYVASYVNCGIDFPRFLKTFFRPKCSYSRHFGQDNPNFNFPSIFNAAETGDFSYLCTRVLDGQVDSQRLPIPYYVIHRYFPKCKGFGQLSDSEISRAVLSPVSLLSKSVETGLTREDVRKYATRLGNAFERCRREFGVRNAKEVLPDGGHTLTKYEFSIFDYARIFPLVWSGFKSTIMKYARTGLEGYNLDYYYYDNIEDVYENRIVHTLGSPPPDIIEDCNYFPVNMSRTSDLTQLYNKKKKQSRITNYVMTSMGYDV